MPGDGEIALHPQHLELGAGFRRRGAVEHSAVAYRGNGICLGNGEGQFRDGSAG